MIQTKVKIRLKGHETFILREGWITKGLVAVRDNPSVFSENSGADALGVGTNMAKAIRYWLRESDLISESPRTGAQLTVLGKLLLDNDPYLEDDFSLWMVHINLCQKLNTVTSWYLFFNLLDVSEFTKEELGSLMTHQILVRTGNEEPSQRSVSDDCTAILNMYIREHLDKYDPEDKKISPFSKLGLVRKDGNKYQKIQPNLNTLNEMVVLYMLQGYFTDQKQKSISIGDLLGEEMQPGKILNLKRVALNEYLDMLDNQEYIIVNRTAGLDMVYQNCDLTPQQVAEQYYATIER